MDPPSASALQKMAQLRHPTPTPAQGFIARLSGCTLKKLLTRYDSILLQSVLTQTEQQPNYAVTPRQSPRRHRPSKFPADFNTSAEQPLAASFRNLYGARGSFSDSMTTWKHRAIAAPIHAGPFKQLSASAQGCRIVIRHQHISSYLDVGKCGCDRAEKRKMPWTLGSRPLVLGGAAAHSALRTPRLPMRSNVHEDTAGLEVSSGAAPQAGWHRAAGAGAAFPRFFALPVPVSLCQLTGRLVLRNTFIELEEPQSASLRDLASLPPMQHFGNRTRTH